MANNIRRKRRCSAGSELSAAAESASKSRAVRSARRHSSGHVRRDLNPDFNLLASHHAVFFRKGGVGDRRPCAPSRYSHPATASLQRAHCPLRQWPMNQR
jgi:hypothetical protein